MAAQEQVVEATIGGAVTGALEAGVPAETITAAVHRAIQRHSGGSADESIGELMERLRATVDRARGFAAEDGVA